MEKFFPNYSSSPTELIKNFWFSITSRDEKTPDGVINGRIYIVVKHKNSSGLGCREEASITCCERPLLMLLLERYGFSVTNINNKLMPLVEVGMSCPYYMEHLLSDKNSNTNMASTETVNKIPTQMLFSTIIGMGPMRLHQQDRYEI